MKSLLILFLAYFSITFFSCNGPNPEETLSPNEKDVYVSNHDPSVDFSNYKTFSITDSVTLISNDSETPTREKNQTDEAIIEAIKNEMQNLGYILVDTSQNPDLGLQVTKIALSYTGVNYSPSYYYDPFYSGFYGGYGGYYYPSYYIYEVRRGSVIIDMIDLKNSTSSDQLKIVWNGQYLDGLGSLSSDERIINGVRNLFIQSTYLKH